MKKFCAMLLCILTSYLCFGQNDYHFSIAPRFSFTYGELTEILYGYDNEIVSRLEDASCDFGVISTLKKIPSFLDGFSVGKERSLPLRRKRVCLPEKTGLSV